MNESGKIQPRDNSKVIMRGVFNSHPFTRVFIVLTMLLLLLSVSCSGQTTQEIPVTVEVTKEIPITVEVTREVVVTVELIKEIPVTVIVVATPSPLPLPLPELGTMKSPIPFGEPGEYLTRSKLLLSISLLQVLRGQEAFELVRSLVPEVLDINVEDGKELLAAYFVVENISKENDEAADIWQAQFSAVVNGVEIWYDMMIDGKSLLSDRIFVGGRTEGWVIYQIPVDSEIQGFRFFYDHVSEKGIWFGMPSNN